MISLKHYLDEFEMLQPVLDELKENYANCLRGNASSMLPLDESISQVSSQFSALLDRLSEPETWTPPALAQLRAEVSKLQAAYKESATRALAARDEDIRRILQSLSEAAANLAAEAEDSGTGLTAVTSRLEALRNVDNLTELRQRLEKDLADLKVATTKLRSSHDGYLAKLKLELTTFKTRWEESRTEAMTDELTGLPNRRAGEKAMRGFIESGRGFCILLLDLDKFKQINDRWGHLAGDLVLKNFSKRLRNDVRATDTVCRWGGDEFVVLLPDCTLRQAVDRAGRISDSFGIPMELNLEGRTVRTEVKACVGAAEHHAGETPEALMQRADERMYHLKGNRRDGGR